MAAKILCVIVFVVPICLLILTFVRSAAEMAREDEERRQEELLDRNRGFARLDRDYVDAHRCAAHRRRAVKR